MRTATVDKFFLQHLEYGISDENSIACCTLLIAYVYD